MHYCWNDTLLLSCCVSKYYSELLLMMFLDIPNFYIGTGEFLLRLIPLMLYKICKGILGILEKRTGVGIRRLTGSRWFK